MLLFLLPQVAYHYCLLPTKSDDEISVIVLDDDENDDDNKEGTYVKSDSGVLGEEIRVVFSNDVGRVQMPADQWRLCKESALDLLDGLSNHLRSRQDSRTKDKRGARKDSQLANATLEEQAISSLVDSVPSQLVAQAAVSCSQYARAILHTELSLRLGSAGSFSTLFGHVDDAAMSTIMELYFSMGDADGVAGAASCRKNVDLQLSIRKYEIEGNWSHALIGHESLIRSRPESEDYQRGWIGCLQNMGQWEGSWAASKGLFRPRPSKESERQLSSACFAAAWRLGKWDWTSTAIGGGREGDDVLTAFDALNCALLLRISRDDGNDICGLELLPRLRASRLAADGILSCPIEELCELALRTVGRGFAETATLRKQALASSYATSASPDTQNEIHAHMLGDIALLVKHLGSNTSSAQGRLPDMLSSLAEQWRERIQYLPPAYSVQEPVLALHARLYDIVLNHYVEQAPDADRLVCTETVMRQMVRTYLQAAQLARMAGFRATALGILTHAELTCAAKPALLAPLQIEHAQILWDEGHASDAMSAMSRVSDELWAKLKSQYENSSVAEPTPTAGAEGLLSSGTQVNDIDGNKFVATSALDVDDTKSAFAKASRYLAIWQEETKSTSTGVVQARFERIIRVQSSDKAFYAFGQFYNNLLASVGDKDLSRMSPAQHEHRMLQMSTLQYYIVRNYSRAVIYSTQYLFQALPRLLTVWLDSGATVLQPAESKNLRLLERFRSTNRVMANMAKRLPAYSFLVVLSQLVSRICHANDEVFAILESIILSVLELYPQQALWQLMGVQRSTYAARSERCNVILNKARAEEKGPSGRGRSSSRVVGISALILQASKLTDMLLGLCNAVPPARTVTAMLMSKDFKQLLKCTPLDIIVPLERCLVPNLPDASGGIGCELALSPRPDGLDAAAAAAAAEAAMDGVDVTAHTISQRAMLHQPFSSDLPTIAKFAEEIEIMSSLQRPKKITMVGSDGRSYSFLCKPKDDLRKDARLMEFNSMINHLLRTNAQTQKRGLHIRTYAVVPLNEECGLIQWVAPTTGIRHVLNDLYKARGSKQPTVPQLKTILAMTSPAPATVFTETLLPLFPSVMHEWFLQSFPDPPSWLASRTNFTRSAAVMSIV
ncbi:hypothetical protein GGI21_001973, partial [Coemansia aciculifera]